MIDLSAAKSYSASLALLTDERRAAVLCHLADDLVGGMEALLEANACDMRRMDASSAMADRLLLTPERIEAIASDMRRVATLPTPLGRELMRRRLPNGLLLRRVTVPYGVVGVVYEARPNVTFDVFALCFKSGNACVLKGGADAQCSNSAAVALIHDALRRHGIASEACVLMPATHEATRQLLTAVGQVDVCIPRGGQRLIRMVRDEARVPVIETGAGVVNTYFDAAGDVEMGARIVCNAKTRRVSVCNALDCLLVDRSRLDALPELVEPLSAKHVCLQADGDAYAALCGRYPYLEHATEASYGTEFMDYKMAVRTVDGIDAALAHIARYGSGHSECIITGDEAAARKFQTMVDAACVYVNAPTSFTDGGQFGLGAEIGISTQKLGPRGPMGLDELVTYKWLIDGNGQVRP